LHSFGEFYRLDGTKGDVQSKKAKKSGEERCAEKETRNPRSIEGRKLKEAPHDDNKQTLQSASIGLVRRGTNPLIYCFYRA